MVQTQIQKNFAQADIYFQTLNVVNIAQSALMDVSFGQESILPNVFLCQTKIFLFFTIKLDHFVAKTLFYYITNAQA